MSEQAKELIIIVTIVSAAGAIVAAVGGYFLMRVYLVAVEKHSAWPRSALFPKLARLCLVCVIVFSAVILALVGKLNDGIIAFLSGIAGYVLAAAERTPPENTFSNKEPESPGP